MVGREQQRRGAGDEAGRRDARRSRPRHARRSARVLRRVRAAPVSHAPISATTAAKESWKLGRNTLAGSVTMTTSAAIATLRMVSARRPNDAPRRTPGGSSPSRGAPRRCRPRSRSRAAPRRCPPTAAMRLTEHAARERLPTATSSSRSAANTPPATIVRCSPETDSTCASPAIAMTSRASSSTALWSPLMRARAMPAAGWLSAASIRVGDRAAHAVDDTRGRRRARPRRRSPAAPVVLP